MISRSRRRDRSSPLYDQPRCGQQVCAHPQGVIELRFFFRGSNARGADTTLLVLKRKVKKLIEMKMPAIRSPMTNSPHAPVPGHPAHPP